MSTWENDYESFADRGLKDGCGICHGTIKVFTYRNWTRPQQAPSW